MNRSFSSNQSSRLSRFRGCLLAGAVGDALGAPVEFMGMGAIRRCYGEVGITDFAQAYGRVGVITDDTQMTLFTAEGLLRAFVRHAHRGITTYPGVVSSAYLRWLHTQGEASSIERNPLIDPDGWLFGHPELHSRRAPGNTCLSALQAMRRYGEPADNDSKGCGGVMRVAPVGLFASHWGDPKAAFDLACELAGLTHGHPTGRLASGAFAVLVHELALGRSLDQALDRSLDLLAHKPGADETRTAITRARELAATGEDRPRALARLGGGWVAEEALAMAIYCALVARDLRDGLILAVNHDGDSDSTGAMTGNLLGALWGEAAIPAEWRQKVELGDVIAEIADDLHDCYDWKIGDSAVDAAFDDHIFSKYPGC